MVKIVTTHRPLKNKRFEINSLPYIFWSPYLDTLICIVIGCRPTPANFNVFLSLYKKKILLSFFRGSMADDIPRTFAKIFLAKDIQIVLVRSQI